MEDFRDMFDAFEMDQGFVEILADSETAMLTKQNGIVVADQRASRDGRILENIGFFNPRTEPETVHIDVERARYWLGEGAKPSEAVERLLKSAGAYEPVPAAA